jgi:hypothetical protein
MQKITYFTYILSMIVLVSCNSENTSNDSEVAYQNYRNFINEVERDTVITDKDISDDWQIKSDTLKRNLERYKSGTASHMESYTPERREEVNAFDDRFEVALELRQKRFNEVSHRYKLRKELLNLTVSEDDMSSINADNLIATYTHFVNTLKKNGTNYNTKDWQLIEGWWNALNNRRDAVIEELQTSDREKLDRLQKSYQEMRVQALNLLPG